MSFARQKPSGWSTNDPFTPTQANGIDANLADAFDKVGGETVTGTSTWENVLTMSQSGINGGSAVWRVGNLGDADATIDCDYDEYVFTSAVTVARTFTLRSTTTPRPLRGTRLRVSADRPAASGFTDMARFYREGAVEIGRIIVAGNGSIDFTFDGSDWQVTGTSGDGQRVAW